MIISCTNCATRLQLDDAKVPARPFTVRCPKCHQIISAQPGPANGDGSAVAAGGDLPASSRSQRDGRVGVPVLALSADEADQPAPQDEAHEAPADAAELIRLLSSLAARAASDGGGAGAKSRAEWDRRRALICMSTSHRDDVARSLKDEGYEVSLAQDTARAMALMREDKVGVLVLDPEFDMAEQGAAFIMREVNTLRPAERRRLVVVHVSPSARTEDAHAAFLANVNLIVNTGDAAELPRALERTLRDTNELYKDFNRALGVPAL